MTPLSSQLAELDRELRLRRHCYPRWVEAGTLKAADATYRLTVLDDVRRTLVMLQDLVGILPWDASRGCARCGSQGTP